MLFVFLQNIASHMLFWALHLEAGSFPRPLSPRQEAEAFRASQAGSGGYTGEDPGGRR